MGTKAGASNLHVAKAGLDRCLPDSPENPFDEATGQDQRDYCEGDRPQRYRRTGAMAKDIAQGETGAGQGIAPGA